MIEQRNFEIQFQIKQQNQNKTKTQKDEIASIENKSRQTNTPT